MDDLLELLLDLLGELAETFLGAAVGKDRKRKSRGGGPKKLPDRRRSGRNEKDPWERKEKTPPWEK